MLAIHAHRLDRKAPGVIALILLAALVWPLLNLAGSPAPSVPALLEHTSKSPLLFEPNAGQTDPQVRYIAHVPGGTHFFTASGIALSLDLRSKSDLANLGSQTLEVSTLSMDFIGANPDVALSQDTPSTTTVNYFTGSDPTGWLTGMQTYQGVTYNSLYNGIDLRYEGTGNQLKGTYTLAPGADPGSISWQYRGAQRVVLDDRGNLQITLNSAATADPAVLVEQAPVAWQEIGGERVSVASAYAIAADGSIGFTVGIYDRSMPLTITPQSPTKPISAATGPNRATASPPIFGNIDVTGITNSDIFPLVNPYQSQMRGYYNAFVAKFNLAGQPIYITISAAICSTAATT